MTDNAASGMRVVSRSWAITAMLGSAACWGSATVMTKGALDVFDPFVLLTIQLTSSVVVLWIAVIAFSVRLDEPKRMLIAGSTGIFEPGLAYAVGVPGLALTTASNASVIAALEPVFIFLGAWLIFRTKLDGFGWFAVLLAVVGVAMVSAVDVSDFGAGAVLGDGLILLGTAFAAIYVLASSRLALLLPAILITALQQSVGLVFVLCLMVLALALGWQSLPVSVTPIMLLLATVSGLIQYALAFWLYMVGLQRLPPGLAGMFLTTTPIFGILGGIVFLGERLVLVQLVGVGIIIVALFTLLRREPQ
jgi:drug/metabolite transporter (DMT)-like permease